MIFLSIRFQFNLQMRPVKCTKKKGERTFGFDMELLVVDNSGVFGIDVKIKLFQ